MDHLVIDGLCMTSQICEYANNDQFPPNFCIHQSLLSHRLVYNGGIGQSLTFVAHIFVALVTRYDLLS